MRAGSVVSVLFSGLALACSASHPSRIDGGVDAADAPDAAIDADADADVAGCLPRASEEEITAMIALHARAYCERVSDCDDERRWADVETCLRYEPRAWFEARRAVPQYSLRTGTSAIDRDAIPGCLARWECPWLQSVAHFGGWWFDAGTHPCRAVFPARCGAAREGEPCRVSEDCEDTHYCRDDYDACPQQRCVPRLAEGSACASHAEPEACARREGEASLCFRATSTDELRCRRGQLAGPAGEGEPCGPIDDTDVVRLVSCADGLICEAIDPVEPLPRVCVTLPALGEPCTASYACATGLVCWAGTCVEPRLFTPIEPGDACDTSESENHCNGQYRTQCVGGTCLASGAMGTPCDSSWGWSGFDEVHDVTECDGAMVCDYSDGTCQLELDALGERCLRDWECASDCCRSVPLEGQICVDYDPVACPREPDPCP